MTRTTRPAPGLPPDRAVLRTWAGLNRYLVTLTDERVALALLELELANRCRKMVVLRIHSRYVRLRDRRERTELVARLRALGTT